MVANNWGICPAFRDAEGNAHLKPPPCDIAIEIDMGNEKGHACKDGRMAATAATETTTATTVTTTISIIITIVIVVTVVAIIGVTVVIVIVGVNVDAPKGLTRGFWLGLQQVCGPRGPPAPPPPLLLLPRHDPTRRDATRRDAHNAIVTTDVATNVELLRTYVCLVLLLCKSYRYIYCCYCLVFGFDFERPRGIPNGILRWGYTGPAGFEGSPPPPKPRTPQPLLRLLLRRDTTRRDATRIKTRHDTTRRDARHVIVIIASVAVDVANVVVIVVCDCRCYRGHC